MRTLIVVTACLLSWAPYAMAGTSLLAGCRNCAVSRVVSAPAVVAETTTKAVAEVATAVVTVARVGGCPGGVCGRSRSVAATRRGWFGRTVARSRVRN